ncbi:hypothetical protein GCM10007978_19300 [Shewanella hanedai]|uniref:ParB/Sulfiredoxin domain-containing protein n=1 Tax=Shewanella hanedai TaxID=25 RepID=A0A553JDY7_SHEHA|nr:hypothetical protein [Shewanella hanedai]TRY10640.1 hypothetical protein FN961_25120 [Shewanella hanedai]GGI81593.1 hypothetical protein GCM10007978_19300 [Shewanella hanedai]
MLISQGKPEEVFVLREFNVLIDIEKLIGAINRNSIKYLFEPMDISEIECCVRSDIIEKIHIENMCLNRSNEPIIITTLGDKDRIIDGNHRFVKRKNDGFNSCKVVYIEQSELKEFIEQFQH